MYRTDVVMLRKAIKACHHAACAQEPLADRRALRIIENEMFNLSVPGWGQAAKPRLRPAFKRWLASWQGVKMQPDWDRCPIEPYMRAKSFRNYSCLRLEILEFSLTYGRSWPHSTLLPQRSYSPESDGSPRVLIFAIGVLPVLQTLSASPLKSFRPICLRAPPFASVTTDWIVAG